MGEYACDSFAVGTRADAVADTGFGLNVGYFTEISCRNISRSIGDALIGAASTSSDSHKWYFKRGGRTFVWHSRQSCEFSRQLFDRGQLANATTARQDRLPEN